MEPLPQAELAQCAAQKVAEIAANLQNKWRRSLIEIPSKMKPIRNLVMLASSLQVVAFNPDKYEQGEQRDRQINDVGKLEMLLWGLELVCTVCHPLYTITTQHLSTN